MKIGIWKDKGWTVMLHTIMGMQVGLEMDFDNNWVSFSLLLIKITIIVEPSIDPFSF